MSWAIVATTFGGALTTLLGVTAGGLLGRRSQDRHWLRDTKASAYRSLLREYTRIEFDVRRSYLGQVDITSLDWARWGAAVTELSLVADGDRHDDHWQVRLSMLADAQLAFVNAARRSLSREQPPLNRRIGGPLILETPDDVKG